MIVVTGAAGFIGSVLVGALNDEGQNNLIIVDQFDREDKMKNLANKNYELKIDRADFIDWFSNNAESVDFIFHIGARTDTTEFDVEIFNRLNLNYTKDIWKICAANEIPMVYASSAATYGDGSLGYDDNHDIVEQLKPLNPYGESKNDFDKWALKQEKTLPFWYGLKFFNVYGPNEYHKGRMASVVYHAFNQISKTKAMKLFQSHNPDYKDGEQERDFVYVKDLSEIMLFLMHHRKDSGLYNIGTGEARTFLDLVKNTFSAMGVEEQISFIPTPEDIRDKYQYFTEAEINKLRSIGYDEPFTSLEEGVKDYVQNYLKGKKYN